MNSQNSTFPPPQCIRNHLTFKTNFTRESLSRENMRSGFDELKVALVEITLGAKGTDWFLGCVPRGIEPGTLA